MNVGETAPATRVRLDSSRLAELGQQAVRTYPREACALLLGELVDGRAHVTALRPCVNVALDERRFELDPGEIVRVHGEAEARGLDVLGVWHSHPDTEPAPSAEDESGIWSGWLALITRVEVGAAGETRAFRLADDAFVELPLESGTNG